MTGKRPPEIFNRALLRQRRARAVQHFADHNFLHQRAMDDIVDRLETVKRGFERALFYGAGDLIGRLTSACGVETIINGDLAASRLVDDGCKIVFDEETAPFAPERFDLIVSLLTLHTANDLVGALAQARVALKPDGLFIAAIFGEGTLKMFRSALYDAETELTGGVSARIAPFAGIQDFGQALDRAGFALPVVDVDKCSVRYAEPYRLLRDLRGMGETSALASAAAPLQRKVLFKALENFAASGANEQFEMVYLTGWAPHDSQQKPLRPGSGKMPFEEAVNRR